MQSVSHSVRLSRSLSVLLCALVALATSARADEAGARAIVVMHDKRMEAYETLLAAAQTPEERQRLRAEKPDANFRAKDLIREFRGQTDQPWVLPYFAWIFNNCPEIGKGRIDELRSIFARQHLRSPGAGEVAIALTNLPDRRSLELAEEVLAKHPDEREQGQAAMAVAYMLKFLGEDPKINQRRLRLIRQAIKDAADMPAGRQTVADVAAEELYSVRFLEKGGTAPDFTTTTVEGQTVTLSQLLERKVVVLVFWASQAEASAQTAEFLREMRAQLPSEKVEIIGVMPDNRDFVRKLLADGEATWPSVSDPDFELIEQYRVKRFPACFVIDRESIVRYNGVVNSFAQLTAEALIAPPVEENAAPAAAAPQSE